MSTPARIARSWPAAVSIVLLAAARAGASGASGDGDGADEVRHWAYIPPERPSVGASGSPAIDELIAAHFAERGLEPAPVAAPATLLRRLALDLTGLPPSLDELDRFLADPSEEAYAAEVERLLGSPHYGERQARWWLDLARYADSDGYEKDNLRTMWPYRDWVIAAFNADVPYDRFTLEQIAGDLLPDPTRDQRVATGFHRNTMLNKEGGTDPEEFRTDAVVDRVNTTATIWLGSTLACAQCHSHKYDPFSQREYYELYAFFNQTRDTGNADAPVLRAPTPGQEAEEAQLEAKLERLRGEVETAEWESIEPVSFLCEQGTTLTRLADGSLLASGASPGNARFEWTVHADAPLRVLRLEGLSHGSLPARSDPGDAGTAGLSGPGRGPDGAFGVGSWRMQIVAADGSAGEAFAASLAPAGFGLGIANIVLPERLTLGPGERLRFELQHDGPHSLGRFRVRTTDGEQVATRVAAIEETQRAQRELADAVPRALVMEAVDEPRESHVHVRGHFLNPGDLVEPDVPAVLHDWSDEWVRDRAGLARWLVDRRNPLAARVAVNRVWQLAFGVGLVATSDDFGTRGEAPSHPQLLDWLAVEFMDRGWSFKELWRTIVHSQAYRRSSHVARDAYASDPDNRWLARGPRFRAEAETVRDIALAVSGRLDRTVGGPSVFPPQPRGIWNAAYDGRDWASDADVGRYRRGLYTFWRRTAPYPTLLLFDATSREIACARRERSNTPLQALALMNDPAFLEAAGALAVRVLDADGPGNVDEGGNGDDAERLALAFRMCTGRGPEAGELDVLLDLLERTRRRFDADEEAARAWLEVTRCEPGRNRQVSVAEHAAWAAVANVLLNLDETVTKG